MPAGAGAAPGLRWGARQHARRALLGLLHGVNVLLALAEEWCRAVAREAIRQGTRVLNGWSAFFVSLMSDASYYSDLRASFKRAGKQRAAQAFWERRERRGSTFNSVLRREGGPPRDPATSPARPAASVNSSGRSDRGSELGEEDQAGLADSPAGEARTLAGALATPVVWAWHWADSGVRLWWSWICHLVLATLGWLGFPALRQKGLAASTGDLLFNTGGGLQGVLEDLDRRGLVEDWKIGIELLITTVFDFFRWVVSIPAGMLQDEAADAGEGKRTAPPGGARAGKAAAEEGGKVAPETLWEGLVNVFRFSPQLQQNVLGTETAGSTEDIIRKAGYPYERLQVQTKDGYILFLERIPRRESREVVFFQHGVMDSAQGWVANGIVGSQAFAAYESGFDVFLGNFRGVPPRLHSEELIGMRYWDYTVNEIGMFDMGAMIDKIHELKVSDSRAFRAAGGRGARPAEKKPYNLRAVGHSMGGMALLIYLVTRLKAGLPHHLDRMILLTPAGFHHHKIPFIGSFFMLVERLPFRLLKGYCGMYLYLGIFRLVVHKLAKDLQNIPALGQLANSACKAFFGQDNSQWDRALLMPHINMQAMPAFSSRCASHLALCAIRGRFTLYPHSSAAKNEKAYGAPTAPDVAEGYGLIDIPVDLVAGTSDGIIPPANIKEHYRRMRAGGVQAKYKELDFGHLDFTFAPSEELMRFVLARLEKGKGKGKGAAKNEE